MYRIRFHGRGGQGMKTASRVLGSAFFLAGFEVQDAPRYGAERRGAPIFAYVRADHKPIHERGVIRNPDLVIVADDSLIPIPAAGVLEGITENTLLLVNSHEPAEIWKDRLNTQGRILILPVSEQVEVRAELPYVGVSCAAAAACLVQEISQDQLQQAIREELGHLGDDALQINLGKAQEAYMLMSEYAGLLQPTSKTSMDQVEPPDWIDIPFEQARLSAPIIHAGATSEFAATGVWRSMRPVIDYERCNRCWWVCSTFCPDSAIKVNQERYPEIDYQHCKGCMVCVAQCPPHAIRAVEEHEAAKDEEEVNQ